MSAAAVLARAEAAGLRLRVEAGRLRWRCRDEPPADLLVELRRYRGELPALLTDHDAAEAEAMAAHYAAPAGPDLPQPDPLTRGLLATANRHSPLLKSEAERKRA